MKKYLEDKQLTEQQIIDKLEHFCAYQERCLADVKKKLVLLNVIEKEQQQYIDYLESNNFINEKRFVERFTNGKLNIKSWGKQKIIYQLKQKNIDMKAIESAIEAIDETMYVEKLENLLKKKNLLIKEPDNFKKRQKLINYAQQKGYELGLIVNVLKKIV